MADALMRRPRAQPEITVAVRRKSTALSAPLCPVPGRRRPTTSKKDWKKIREADQTAPEVSRWWWAPAFFGSRYSVRRCWYGWFTLWTGVRVVLLTWRSCARSLYRHAAKTEPLVAPRERDRLLPRPERGVKLAVSGTAAHLGHRPSPSADLISTRRNAASGG